MNDIEQTQATFRKIVYECIDRAEKMFDIDLGRVAVTFDIRGTNAGMAWQREHLNIPTTYALQFNREAMRVDWDEMVNSTIPHEVAHLVAYAAPHLRARDHNLRWRAIAIKLGDVSRGNICHTIPISAKPKRRTQYRYRNSMGSVMDVTARHHLDIQAGATVVLCRKHKVRFLPEDYQGLA